jgi:glycosyltransferase involved in cell wall biosynthesis
VPSESTPDATRAAIVIPARNEEAAIGLVLDEIPRDRVSSVIVVDNGSTDRTADVARARGAVVVEEPTPGYGAACLAGIARTDASVDIIVILDADHSDYPADLPRLLGPIAAGEADFVIGSRVLGAAEPGALPWNQRWGNWLACRLLHILYGVRFTDMGPFRAIRRDALLALGMRDRTFGWNAEMQARALIAGLRIREVPVRYRRRTGRSKISGTVRGTLRAGTRIIATILMYYPEYRRSRRRLRS